MTSQSVIIRRKRNVEQETTGWVGCSELVVAVFVAVVLGAGAGVGAGAAIVSVATVFVVSSVCS